jgi:hypothetical protein
MATYFWDLGFDANAILATVTRDNVPFTSSFLQNGFVLSLQNDTANVPATPVKLSVGDQVGFNVFNVTAAPTETYSISEGVISFQSAVNNQSNTSPFSTSTITIAQTSPSGTGISTIFSGIQANQTSQIPTAAIFPIYNVTGLQEIVNDGRFLMHVSLKIEGPNGAQVFYHDPEMVVGSVG